LPSLSGVQRCSHPRIKRETGANFFNASAAPATVSVSSNDTRAIPTPEATVALCTAQPWEGVITLRKPGDRPDNYSENYGG